MVDFSVQYEKGTDAEKYIRKHIPQNMNKSPLLDVKIFYWEDKAFFHIKPLFIPLYWFTPLILAVGYIFTGYLGWPLIIVSIIPGLTYLFNIKLYWLLMLHIGKYVNKYRGKIKCI